MGRVLVDEHEALRAFGHDVALPDLAQRPERRLRRRLACHQVLHRHAGASRRLRGARVKGARCHGCGRRAIEERLAATQRRTHRTLDRREHCILVTETDLALGRVHVHVHQLGVDTDVEHRHRVASSLQASLVTLLQRVQQRARGDGSRVHRQHYPVAAAATYAWLRHDAFDQRQADDLEHLRGHRGAMHSGRRASPVSVSWRAERYSAVDGELELHVRMEQCI